jgi:hypothetical protein
MESIRRIQYGGLIYPELFAKAQRLHAGKWRLVAPWFFPVAMTAVMSTQNSEVSIFVLAIVFVIGCVFPLIFWRWTERQWRSVHRRSPYLSEDINCTVTDLGIEFTSSAAAGLIKWASFIKVKELPDLLLLYQAPNLFNIVPREFFASTADWEYTRELIRARVNKGA